MPSCICTWLWSYAGRHSWATPTVVNSCATLQVVVPVPTCWCMWLCHPAGVWVCYPARLLAWATLHVYMVVFIAVCRTRCTRTDLLSYDNKVIILYLWFGLQGWCFLKHRRSHIEAVRFQNIILMVAVAKKGNEWVYWVKSWIYLCLKSSWVDVLVIITI